MVCITQHQVHVGIKMVGIGRYFSVVHVLHFCMCSIVPSYSSIVYKNGLLHISDGCDGKLNYCFE